MRARRRCAAPAVKRLASLDSWTLLLGLFLADGRTSDAEGLLVQMTSAMAVASSGPDPEPLSGAWS